MDVNDLLASIGRTIRERRLFRRGERILVAVSGGADSMALLHLLHALSADQGWKLSVAHFNHQLRGRASATDQRFVERAARALRLPCHSGRGPVRAVARASGQSLEMAARELRHRFLAKTACRLGCRCIALAHHADDQVELFFLRLLRGAGGEGLAGMKWSAPSPADRRIRLVRPLLATRRAALRAFARHHRIRFREDASNATTEMLRNRVRHELLPLLRRRYQPALEEIILRAMEIVGGEAEFVAEAARAALRGKPPPRAGWPAGVQRRMLQLQLQARGVPAEFGLIESLRSQPGRRICVNPRLAVACDRKGRLHFTVPGRPAFNEQEMPVALTGRAGEFGFGGLQVRWRIAPAKGRTLPPRKAGQEWFDAGRLGSRIRLRHWRAGDRFRPIGMDSAVKLQDWFTNRKVPAARRRRLVVGETEAGEIFWVEGQRIAEVAKLRPETKRRLLWRWRRG
jgi:tRNA(Ile)-lysidine synthase